MVPCPAGRELIAQRRGETGDLLCRRDLRRADEQGVAKGRVVGLGVGQRQAGQDAVLEQPPVNGPCVGHKDRKFVEVRAAV